MQSLALTGSFTWDLTRDRMRWTDETFRLLSLDPANTLPSLERLLDCVVEEDRGGLQLLFENARDTGHPFSQEFRILRPDGSHHVLQSRAEVLTDPRTKLLDQLTCTLRDITALREAESATRRELRFRLAIEQSLAAGVVVGDDEGRILSVNPAFCEMTGWNEQELLRLEPPYPYWPKEELPAIEKAFALALAGQTPPGGFELRFCRRDGTRFDVLVNVAPLLEGRDQRLGWLGTVTDISAIQETRRELLATNERLQIAQHVAEFGIWDWDPQRDKLFWDRQSFAIFGHPDATDPQAVWQTMHGEEEQERLSSELKRLIASGGTTGQDLLRIRWPDGSAHEVLSTYLILRDETGAANRVLGINRDITREMETEQELRDANRRLAAALEGGSFGTFEHIIGTGDVNWSPANYEINGIDPAITDPAELFAAWKKAAGDFYPQLMERMSALPVTQDDHTYDYLARPAGQPPRRIRTSIFIERDPSGQPVRLVGVTRRIDAPPL
jgi:PAS domain S-box-containing protein